MKENKGYTLIEMIIVIAIMAILAGMAFGTTGIIQKAKCSAAASDLSDQMGSLLVKTDALSEAKNQRLCLLIRKNNAQVTYADGSQAKANSYSVILGTEDGSNFTEKVASTAEATLPNIIEIEYTPSDSTQLCPVTGVNNDSYMIIEFNKSNGSVRYGAGEYAIKFKGSEVATVYLDATTGSHKVK